MAGLQSIKQRRNSVENIKKITHAMELVATSKMRKAREEYDHILTFENLLNDTFDNIFDHLNAEEIRHSFGNSNKSTSKLYIVFTSDLGLAGSFNSNIFKLAKNTIKKKDKLIIIGLKGINALKTKYKNQIIKTYHQDTINSTRLSQKISKICSKMYQEDAINSINVIYNKYINNLVQQETLLQIYPFDVEEIIKNVNIKKSHDNTIIDFEPSASEVIAESTKLYLSAKINTTIAASKLSEMASRRIAMENATDNAGELIEDLNKKFNSRRQAKITQELTEIIGGADAV